ncbi:MAG TPA: M28 family peptidase [Candidatus Marinimicrobia bacterium]|nr:M28 family peptidase [Candidatus Neomarinimicrobiota bacterium]
MKKSFYLILILISACSSGGGKFDGGRAFQFLNQQCDLGPRNPGSPGHSAQRTMLIEFLRPLADTLIIQNFEYLIPEENEVLNLTNIIAGFNIRSANGLLIGAHWDTRPRAEYDPDPAKRKTPIIGANDGASGVAVLMHLAEILSRQQPPRTIYLVFFDGEDYGFPGTLDYYCLGSEYFAKNLPIPKPEEAIIIDMIGDADLRIPVERNSVKSHPQLIKKLWAIADRHNFSAFVHQIDEEIYDDHLMLIQHAGIPSVDLIDFQYPNRFINYWHTTLDTPDKCSAESLEIVGTVLYDYIFYGSEER